MTKAQEIAKQVGNIVVGKQAVIEKALMALLAGGHILLEDVPGVGKTTLALAFSKALGLSYKRMQFTPDVMPSDVTGYTAPDRETGEMVYLPGTAFCNLFLADEINRASSKTQSALLEVMEEGGITVDGVTHAVPQPYSVIATQNPVGSSGTQPLPESQLDRFMIRISIGYPDKQSEVEMLRRQTTAAAKTAEAVVAKQEFLSMQQDVKKVYVSDALFAYLTDLVCWTRSQPLIRLGASPRGTIALCNMAKACAYLRGRDFMTPQDAQEVFPDVCAHRILLNTKGHAGAEAAAQLLEQAVAQVPAPKLV